MPLALALAGTVHGAGGLPLETPRGISFATQEGSWMSVDVAPNGRHIAFDLLGDVYIIGARGGRAIPLLTGPAFESQPVFSPDGRSIAFVSDRDGSENLWIAAADGTALRRLSALDDDTELMSPAWTPDGDAVYVSQLRPDTAGAEIWRYSADGAGGRAVTEATGTPRHRASAVGAAPSPDGRHLYYATRAGHSGRDGTPWRIVRRDLASGAEEPVVSAPAGAARPLLSPNGRLLAYVSRRSGATSLRIRDLASGMDRELAYPVQLDQQSGWATMDVAPRFSFTRDGRALVFTNAARLWRVSLHNGAVAPLPFTAEVSLDLGQSLTREIPPDEGPVRARLMQTPRESPDGTRIAFSALTRVYTMALADDATPRPLTTADTPAFHPSWSPDGRWITFISWDAAGGGHLWRVPAEGGRARRVSSVASYYTHPVFTPDGRHIVALRSSHYDRMHQAMEYGAFRQAELVQWPVVGGDAVVLASGNFAGPPQFAAARLYLYGADGLVSFAPDGTDQRVHARITGPPYYFDESRATVHALQVSPDGRRALAQIRSQVYLLTLQDGDPWTADLSDASPYHARVTTVGGDYIGWSTDGSHYGWAVGSTYYRQSLETDERASFEAVVEVPRDRPQGAVVLRGATVLTMRGDEAVLDADIVVVDGRIIAVGIRGTVAVPDVAEVRDVGGRFIVPGLVDAHGHWADIRRDVLERQPYGFLANLAFGVTAGLDPSTLTVDMLAYQDLLDAGIATGMRAFSTGPAVFSFNEFSSYGEVVEVLTRYRDHYRVANLKQYRVGNRRQRQWFAQASAALGMVPTTEGADNFKLSITQVLDGFAGVEHALPVAGIGDDVVTLFARARTAYVPTLAISDGASSVARFVAVDAPHANAKVRRFFPPFVIEQKTRELSLLRDDQYLYRHQARDAAAMFSAGARLGAGSHSEFQGIGLHWEIQAMVEGGLTPIEALRVATIGSADAIGRAASHGTIEPGKYADLVVLRADPRVDIRNTLTIELVMKNGRLYDGDTLDELWPRRRPLPPLWFWQGAMQ